MQASSAQPDTGAIPDQQLEAIAGAIAEGLGGAVAGRAAQCLLNDL